MNARMLSLNKRILNTIKLEQRGFKLTNSNDKDFDYEYRRYSGGKVDVLNYGLYLDDSRTFCAVNVIRYRIIFPVVNNIISAATGKVITEETVYATPTIGMEKYTEYLYKLRDKPIPYKIFNEVSFNEALDVFQEQLETIVLPFFDKIQTLQQVNDEILEKVDWNIYNKYISGETGAKVLIIMKLCNNPRYEAYKERSDKLIAEQLNDPNYAQYTDILHNQQIIMDEVFNYLESGKYLEIDSSNILSTTIQPPTVPKREVPQLPSNEAVSGVFQLLKPSLNALGIHFDNKPTLNDYRNDANWQSWGMEEPNNIDWKYYLLLFAGTNVYHSKSEKYIPVSPNVYYFNAEWDGFVDYAEIIERLNLLTGKQLPITNLVCEEEGICSFSYKGEQYEWKFQLQGDWTDPEIFESFIGLVKPDLKKEFFIMEEGQGGIIVYYSPEEKSAFEEYFDKNLKLL